MIDCVYLIDPVHPVNPVKRVFWHPQSDITYYPSLEIGEETLIPSTCWFEREAARAGKLPARAAFPVVRGVEADNQSGVLRRSNRPPPPSRSAAKDEQAQGAETAQGKRRGLGYRGGKGYRAEHEIVGGTET